MHQQAPFDTPPFVMNSQLNQSSPAAQLQILVTEPVMAAACAVSTRHLRNLRDRRQIPFCKLGGSIRYSPSAVQQALEKLTVHARNHGRAS